MKRSLAAAGALALFASLAHAQQLTVEAGIPANARTSGVSGNVNSVGSDTMNNLMTLWAEAFIKMYPNVKLQVEGKGSSTARVRGSRAVCHPPGLAVGESCAATDGHTAAFPDLRGRVLWAIFAALAAACRDPLFLRERATAPAALISC